MNTSSSNPLSVGTELIEQANGYQGNLMNCIGTATTNVPVNTVKPLVIPFYEFSDKNPITTDKTNIFANIHVGFEAANVRLFRVKYDIVVGYDDPKLPYIQRQFSGILTQLGRMFEQILFSGITPEYGLCGNSKTLRLKKSTTNIDEFVSILSCEMEDMVRTLGKSDYTIYFPLGWYGKFGHVSGTPADQYCADALSSRAKRMGINLSMYDSEVVDAIYIVKNDDIDGYFGRMPMLSSTIDDSRTEEYVYRFCLDTPALVLARTGSVRALEGLVEISNLPTSPIVLSYSGSHNTPEAKISKSK